MKIYLLGFMASGKSTLGPVLAREGGLAFLDLDEVIVADYSRSIPELFRDLGEDAFRDLESAALSALSDRDDLVLATGGGVVERSDNHPHLRAAHSVYLRWSWRDLRRRLVGKGSGKRPLRAEGMAGLEARWLSRDPLYKSLAMQVLTMREAGGGAARQRALQGLAQSILAAAGEGGS